METTSITPFSPLFIEQSRRLLRDNADAFIAAMSLPPAIGVRLNPLKPSSAFASADTQQVAWCASGRYLAERPNFTLMPQLHAGAFYVQDPSSMIHQAIVAQTAHRGCTYLDLCAAPGGKTTAALASLPDDAVAVANEVVPARARILQENLRKWGRHDVIVTSTTAQQLGRLGARFDIIAADVPCSGEGMMRKDDEARRQWNPGLVKQCAALQREIISDVLPALKPGGILIYSTCTFNREENEDNVRHFIEEHRLENIPVEIDPSFGIGHALDDDISALRFMPHLTRGEGLFVALLRKPEDEACSRGGRVRTPAPEKSEASGWVLPRFGIYRNGTRLHAMSAECAALHAAVASLKGAILDAGTEVAEIKGRDLIPSEALPLSDAYRRGAFPEVELTLDDALRFLRREPITLSADTPRGYVVATFDALPLGMLKNLGNRSNNLYPKEWRIKI